ncbi:cell division control protein 12 [Moniliophthora roreri]|nr:cell division control protein 12 [Moniliophthora roreri]
MDPQICLLLSLRLLFLPHIRLMLVVNEIDDGTPGIFVVHIITKPRCVNDMSLSSCFW